MTEVELQLKLDPEGRTIADDNDSDQTQTQQPQMDYTSKTVLTSLADDFNSSDSDKSSRHETEKRTKFMDDILLDCEIADCALLPRTFWMPATGMEPRCILEQSALEVFRHHVNGNGNGNGVVFDPKTSGCEWWVQIRPSPPAGRYSLLSNSKDKGKGDEKDKDKSDDKEKSDEVDLEADGICFHWDKDEDLRLAMGGNMYIHPHISTVTYLSNSGAPTMALNYRVNTFTGQYMSPSTKASTSTSGKEESSVDAYLSWPKKGKHLSFDGRFLHAAPSNLMEDGAFEQQIKVSDDIDISDTAERKKQTRRQRRVTFLVNIWLNYKPFNVEIFPESMMDKMTKTSKDLPHILFKNECNANGDSDSDRDGASAEHTQCAAKVKHYDISSEQNKHFKQFKWSMGGCGSNESIAMYVPLEEIRNEMKDGGNIQIHWPDGGGGDGLNRHAGVRLIQGEQSEQNTTEEEEREGKRHKTE